MASRFYFAATVLAAALFLPAQASAQQAFSSYVNGLPGASNLTGTEKIVATQSGASKTMTPYQILNKIAGDCTMAAPPSILCTKTNGTPFAASATTDTTTMANVAFTGLSAAAAAADADTMPVNQGASNLKQTFAAVKTWVKGWITKTDVGLSNVPNTDATNASNLASGTVPAARGGAGTTNGALKGNGSGVVSQAATTDLSDVVSSGSWTPSDASGAGLTFTGVSAAYTKIGNMVFAYAQLTYPTTANGSNATIGGLPVTVPGPNYSRGPCNMYSNAGGAAKLLLTGNTATGVIINSSNAVVTNATMAGAVVILSCVYPAT